MEEIKVNDPELGNGVGVTQEGRIVPRHENQWREILLSLSYYNEAQRALFQALPNAQKIDNIVQERPKVPISDFLTYLMFTEKKDVAGFRNYQQLRKKVEERYESINDYLTFSNESVQAKMIGDEMILPDITERIGVSLGLCTINQIHGLTAADWMKIPKAYKKKTMDFRLQVAAAHDDTFVQVENKGSTTEDNSRKPNKIVKQYRRIIKQKNSAKHEDEKPQAPVHNNLYYGTIGVLDNRKGSIAKVWLVDPPAFDLPMDPKKFKLLARLKYYLTGFHNIGVKSRVIKALKNRIKDIEASSNYLEFNNSPLEIGNPSDIRLLMEEKMLATIEVNEINESKHAFGRFFFINANQKKVAYLVAFRESIIKYVLKQNFDRILGYSYAPFSLSPVQIKMLLRPQEYKPEDIPDNLKFIPNEQKKRYETTFHAMLHYSSDGRIFGAVNYIEHGGGSVSD